MFLTTIFILLSISLKDAVIFSMVTLCLLIVFIKGWMEQKNEIKNKYKIDEFLKEEQETKSEDNE
jgi:hypothetical protein